MAFARLWHSREETRGTVVLVHGAAEHSLRYQQFALFLAHNGYNVVAYDQRGHGYTALSSGDDGDPIALKKRLYESPEFGYISMDEGWSAYLDDLSHVLEYVYSRYQTGGYFLFGHSMGSMIVRSSLATLPPASLAKLRGVILSGHPENGGLAGRMGYQVIRRQIQRHGESNISESIDRLVLGRYSRSPRFRSMRTELDWISSDPDEVDAYIADPLCGNVLRLGFYAALVQGNLFVYSRDYRRGLTESPIPLLIFSGSEDPVTGFGKTPKMLADFYRKLGWPDVETRLYDGNRHEVFHDTRQAEAFDDCLKWMEGRLH
jgi:alpha-beta hydrolase superfamily lysophospholipase